MAYLCWYALQFLTYKNTSTKMHTPLKIDLIYNMDHMRISGTEPSSGTLSQTK